ncbi:beta lactamase induction signal transducer AmpG [Legionella beliardensis]|uniref:Beta lactamase induction signal transducer AmpG n=2 Tax=Legionella beliardensis TaxID=91822 RepID=A0A378I200_9GAMM|nr:beta lactamase induction signal transducer AmpG [Legionella beliardensis]
MSSSIPFALVTTTLQSWYIATGLSLATLGWLALIAQAYLFKFLWANYCDTYLVFGHQLRKSWIISMQLIIIFLTIIMSFLSPNKNTTWLGLVAAFIALFSATQDLSIDAYRSELIAQERQQEKLIGIFYIVGFRIGYLFAGAGGLIIAQFYGWQMAYQLMAGIVIIICLITFTNPEKPYVRPIDNFSKFKAIKFLWSKNKSGLFLSFIFFFEFGDSLINSIYPAYLYQIKKYDLAQIALLIKATNIMALSISPLLALFLLRFSFFKAISLGLLGEAICLVLLPVLSDTISHLFWLQLILGLFEGLLGVLIILLYTHLAQGRLRAFNYAFIAAIGGVKSLLTPTLGIVIIHYFSWQTLFCMGAILTLPSYLMSRYLIKKTNDNYFNQPQVI